MSKQELMRLNEGGRRGKAHEQKSHQEVIKPWSSKIACIFLVDTSYSMNYPKEAPAIDQINESMKLFKQQVLGSGIENHEIEIAVISFGGTEPKVVSDFCSISDWEPPVLTASGTTPLGRALELAIKMAGKKAREYKKEDIPSYPPWLIVMTDGSPTDGVRAAREMLKDPKERERYGNVSLWIAAAEDADLKILRSLTDNVVYLEDKDFTPVFEWAVKSMEFMSRSVSEDGEWATMELFMRMKVNKNDGDLMDEYGNQLTLEEAMVKQLEDKRDSLNARAIAMKKAAEGENPDNIIDLDEKKGGLRSLFRKKKKK